MDEILASIRRIIAEEDSDAGPAATPPAAPAPAPAAAAPGSSSTAQAGSAAPAAASGPAPAASQPAAAPSQGERAPPPTPNGAPAENARLLSPQTAAASRERLDALSALVVTPDPDSDPTTLDGLVRDMLRPMMAEWLEARLPQIVESMVAAEIKRITGRG